MLPFHSSLVPASANIFGQGRQIFLGNDFAPRLRPAIGVCISTRYQEFAHSLPLQAPSPYPDPSQYCGHIARNGGFENRNGRWQPTGPAHHEQAFKSEPKIRIFSISLVRCYPSSKALAVLFVSRKLVERSFLARFAVEGLAFCISPAFLPS